MGPDPGLDWIAGSWRPARSGHQFELASLRAPHAPRGSWPRSALPELEEAFEAGQRTEAIWQGKKRGERVRILLEAVEALEHGELGEGRLAEGLGLELEVVRERLAGDLMRAREGLEILRDAGGSRTGVGLFMAHWSDLAPTLVLRLAPWLLGGSPAVVLADARLPEAADSVARALERAGLPPGVVSVLHDDGLTVVRAAMRAPALAWVRARGTREELAELERERAGDGFGAGLTEWSLWPLASQVHVVAESSDPVEQAGLVVERALAPSATLCGQLPDAVGRVLCHQRRLSPFTEELLARLDALPALAGALLPVEPDLPDWMAEAWALGLDEGACPIFGEAPAEARGRAPRGVRPVVFTNVETGGRLNRLERPAPLLRLARVASDEEAYRLRDVLARGPARLA